jgi:chemotaxis protein methyltransferase CheR
VELSKNDFLILKKFIHNVCGIDIPDEKEYLILHRLQPVLEKYNCKDFSEFALLAGSNINDNVREDIIEAITTNETSFFRDEHPFQNLKNHILPKVIKNATNRNNTLLFKGKPKVSILSAGASTGQEGYSIAISIHEYIETLREKIIDIENFSITGIDISSQVLAKAISGEYTEIEVKRGLNDFYINQYFLKTGDKWIVKDNLKKMVTFQKVNFIKQFSKIGYYDIIFCRNVLIYFDVESKKKILEQFYSMLNPGGYLILGSTENLYNLTNLFLSEHINSGIFYSKPMM